jgi:hypothetical protein
LDNENRGERNKGEGKEGDKDRIEIMLDLAKQIAKNSSSVFVCCLSDFTIFFSILSHKWGGGGYAVVQLVVALR